jgi:circadian clock protein KaiC
MRRAIKPPYQGDQHMKDNEIFIKTCIPGLDDAIPGFPKGGLILVSGKPGSGKTIMGMTFIYRGALEAGEPGIYISVYESRERFLQLAKRLGMDFEKLEEKGLFKHVWMPVTMEAGAATAINMILEQIEKMGAKRLVIDSITALKQQFKDPLETRILLQTLLSKIIENLKCTTLLIKEGDPLTGPLDFEEYVADAVIHLERGYFDGRPLRRLEILKLRGVDITSPRLICTIHEGFKVMPPTKLPSLMKPVQQVTPEVFPQDPPGAYTTGIPDLDREIGGYPRGSTVLIEVDPRLTPLEHDLITAPAIASFISKNRHALIIPSGGVSPALIREISSYYGASEQIFLEQLHIFYEKDAPINRERNILTVDFKAARETGRALMEFSVKPIRDTGSPLLAYIGVDRLVQLAGEEMLTTLTILQDVMRIHNSLMIWLAKPIMPWIVERLAPIADMHLKITREHGCLLLYGIKPRTPLYAIQLEPDKTPPIPNLIKIT